MNYHTGLTEYERPKKLTTNIKRHKGKKNRNVGSSNANITIKTYGE